MEFESADDAKNDDLQAEEIHEEGEDEASRGRHKNEDY